MNVVPPDYESDFFDVIQGLSEDLGEKHLRIYRTVEANVIVVWKEIQRIQGNIVVQIARELPGHLNDG